jgi:hypothetical protein
MINFELIDKWGRFEWVNDEKTIKKYPDRDYTALCIHIEATPFGDSSGSGVCSKCTMKQFPEFKDNVENTLRHTIKVLKEQEGYTDQMIIDEVGNSSLFGSPEELVMKLLRDYNNNNKEEGKEGK